MDESLPTCERDEYRVGQEKMRWAYNVCADNAHDNICEAKDSLDGCIDELCDPQVQGTTFAAGAMSVWAEKELGFKAPEDALSENGRTDTCCCISCRGDSDESPLCGNCMVPEDEDTLNPYDGDELA